jgi:hypothetical protein
MMVKCISCGCPEFDQDTVTPLQRKVAESEQARLVFDCTRDKRAGVSPTEFSTSQTSAAAASGETHAGGSSRAISIARSHACGSARSAAADGQTASHGGVRNAQCRPRRQQSLPEPLGSSGTDAIAAKARSAPPSTPADDCMIGRSAIRSSSRGSRICRDHGPAAEAGQRQRNVAVGAAQDAAHQNDGVHNHHGASGGIRSSEVSRAGSQGVAQFMPGTAAEVGLDDPFDPFKALPASAKLLRKLQDEFGNLGLAAAAYNAGSGRIRKWLSGRRALPRETQDYVRIWLQESKIVSMQSELPRDAPCEGVGGLSKAKEVATPCCFGFTETAEPTHRSAPCRVC